MTSSEMPTPPQSLRTLLRETSTFVRIAELVPGRGPLVETEAAKVAAMANELTTSGIAHVLSITDNAGGAPKIYPESLGMLLGDRKEQAIIHLSCKDLNRAGLESRAWSLATAGFQSLLCLSGDYPVDGYRGYALPAFDVDSVGLIQMLREMNQGMPVPNMKGELVPLPKTDFYLGCAVSPFKKDERELMPQYFKLQRKIAVGADYVITQLGYDSRKFDELLKYMQIKGLDVPVMANIYLLSRPVSRFFNKGNVAGVFCSDALTAECEKQAASPDKGKQFFQEFAAKQIAVLKGLGYRGAYLAGPRNAQQFAAIFDLADSYGPDDWKEFAKEIQYPQPGEFYYFEQDPETKLGSSQVNREYEASLRPEGRGRARSKAPFVYKLSRFVHSRLFDPESRGFSMMRDFYLRIDSSPGAKHFFHVLEQAGKVPMYGCKDCGDCSLPDVAYLCPMSQCAKNQRNGPCGGSAQGKCEFFKEKDCIWARAYDRLKGYSEEEKVFGGPAVYRNGALRGESPWANNFLGRDHFGYKPAPKQ